MARLLEPLYDLLDVKVRQLALKPLEGPPQVKLETALRNLAAEVSLYFALRNPLPHHTRYCADGPVAGEGRKAYGHGRINFVQRHDPRSLFQCIRFEDLDKLRTLDELARLFLEAPPEWAFLLPTPAEGDASGDLRGLRHRVWDRFAGEYIRDYFWLVENPKRYDSALAQFLADQFLQRIAKGRLRNLRLTPLLGLWLDGQEVPLSERLRLRPVTDFERHLWLNPDDLRSDIPMRGLEVLGLASVIEYEETEAEHQSHELFNLLNPKLGAPEAAVVAALKLLVENLDGVEGVQPAFMERRTEGSIYEYQQRCSLLGQRSPHLGGRILLSGEQRQQLPALFERIHRLFSPEEAGQLTQADRSLSVALSRWLKSFHRSEPKDWLIDCWVALEGLFTQRGEQGLTNKCSGRISQELAGLGAGSPQQLYQEVRASYESRCDIVHGERELSVDYSSIAWWTRRQLGRILRPRLLQGPGGAAPPGRPGG